MTENASALTVHPTLRYDDAPAAIEFLTGTLGLTAGEVYHDERGQVVHAELGWGDGIVMVGARGEEPGPFDTGRAVIYLVTDEPDALHARVVAAGGTIARELADLDYGSRDFAVRDPEGNIWSFGTYRPAVIKSS
ncbi:MAG TPA: VOC family protein [Pseudonocardia sp.]|jgi:uncharacterized glyoxalase superfamily protein PhnB